MEGVVTWPILSFVVLIVLGTLTYAIRILVYAFSIKGQIELKIAELATKKDIEAIAKKVEDNEKETGRRFDAIWNEATSKHNNNATRISFLEGRMGAQERKDGSND